MPLTLQQIAELLYPQALRQMLYEGSILEELSQRLFVPVRYQVADEQQEEVTDVNFDQ